MAAGWGISVKSGAFREGFCTDWPEVLASRITSDRQPLPVYGANDGPDGNDLDPMIVTPGYSSFHTGGLHVALGNGRVRYISESIDLTTYINLMRRADGAEPGQF